MSLPGSQRVAGTDGNDFSHRERVAEHYKISVETKPRFRLCIYLHFGVALLVIAQLLSVHFELFPNLNIPKPDPWEYVWLLTLIPSIAGLLSMKKNDVWLMNIFFRGTVLLGLSTIMTAIIFNLSDLFTLASLTKISVIISYVFLIVMVQIHAISLYMANILLHSWQQNKSTKKN
mgnify:CR=1 FL=1